MKGHLKQDSVNHPVITELSCSTFCDPADKPWLLSTCPAVLSQDRRSRPHKINHAQIQRQKVGAFLDYFKIQSCNLMFYFIIN